MLPEIGELRSISEIFSFYEYKPLVRQERGRGKGNNHARNVPSRKLTTI